MKAIELNKEEIDKLFVFVRKKYVNFIDVQHELVDHLACDIEDLKAEDSNLTFEKALQKVYSKYPITGFSNLKDAKIKEMNRYWTRTYFKYMKEYFTIPKVLITLALFWTYFKLFDTLGNIAIVLIMSIAMMLYIANSVWLHKKFKAQENRNCLVINTFIGIVGAAYSTPLFVISNIYSNSLAGLETSSSTLIGLSIYATFMTISLHASHYDLPAKLESDLLKKYPYIQFNKS